ncbi:MAG: PLP-dependent aminotransferase family protein, partial [Planctomycetota bacterium]
QTCALPSGLTRQITDQIRDLIASGHLSPEDKLPSTRLLSKELCVNRITVSQAYKQLISEGLVRSGVGSGTYVAAQPLEGNWDNTLKLDRSNYTPFFSQGIRAAGLKEQDLSLMNPLSEDTINFATLVPDERFFPVEAFRQCLDQVIAREGSHLLQYCGTLGYPPLRRYIAERMRDLGIHVSEEEILMVNGAQQGIDLVLRCFLSPNDKIALSIPTYHNIFPIVGLLGASVVPVRMTDQGPDIESLREAVRDPLVRLIYIMPNFQNPTGVTCSAEVRQQIHEIAVARGLPVLEDDFEIELAFTKTGLSPIKALDPDGRVIYLSTFSKSLFPGLRIGWLVASGETLKALSALKKATDLENSALLQAATHEFCRQGHYDRHLTEIRSMIRARMESAFASLEQFMPEEVTWSRPTGGYALWIHLPDGMDSHRVFTLARQEGVLVSPGTIFGFEGNDPGGIRLSLTLSHVEDIRQGIRILAKVIRNEMLKKNVQGPRAPETSQHL